MQKSAQVAGAEAAELEKAMRSSTGIIKKAFSNFSINGEALANMRRDITDVYNEAIDIIRKRTSAIRDVVSKMTKGLSKSSDDSNKSK